MSHGISFVLQSVTHFTTPALTTILRGAIKVSFPTVVAEIPSPTTTTATTTTRACTRSATVPSYLPAIVGFFRATLRACRSIL